ncbi:hypothetical protein B0H13DRAFT_2348664 [Mycena leptocephala]|nr:hypothetical protein B0H13DRAFT_2348664 [Mycena leptocephala]
MCTCLFYKVHCHRPIFVPALLDMKDLLRARRRHCALRRRLLARAKRRSQWFQAVLSANASAAAAGQLWSAQQWASAWEPGWSWGTAGGSLTGWGVDAPSVWGETGGWGDV